MGILGMQKCFVVFRYDVMGGKVGTKWRKYMKTCMFYTWKHENTNVFMYFLHLVPTFSPITS